MPVPLAYGLLAAVLAAIAMVPSLRPAGWSATALPRVGTGSALASTAKQVDPGFRLVTGGGYDGQFYWGIAIDPLARGRAHTELDSAPYRYGHPLLGWLGWIASAGQARAAAAALAVLGLLTIGAAAAGAAALGLARGRSGMEALFVALNPGLLYAAAHDLAEPLCAALLLGAFYGYVRDRRALLYTCLVLLPLSKEEFVLVPLALAGWELARRGRRLRDVVPILATLVPAVGWWIYERATLGAWLTHGSHALGVPFSGWRRALVDAGVHSYDTGAALNQLGEVTIVVLVALLGLLTLAGVRALRLRGPVDLVYLGLAVLALCLASNATVMLRDALRNTSLLLVLVPFVIAPPPLNPPSLLRRTR